MANYNDDEIDDELEDNGEEQPVEGGEAKPAASNRNFLLALGVLGGIFLLLVIALAIVALNRRPQTTPPVVDIQATNNVIETSNARTAAAATQARAMLLTPSLTPSATVTPTVTRTALLAPTNTPGAQAGGLTPTATGGAVGQVDTRTATVSALLTQRAQTSIAATQDKIATRTRTPVKGAGTPTKLPSTGFAEDVGLPGLFGLALGLVVVIILVRRLRIATQ